MVIIFLSFRTINSIKNSENVALSVMYLPWKEQSIQPG